MIVGERIYSETPQKNSNLEVKVNDKMLTRIWILYFKFMVVTVHSDGKLAILIVSRREKQWL